jgi:hypothetical protein
MKLSMKWGGKNQKPKTCKTPPKVRWDLLGIPDPRKVSTPKSIEEIRQQVQNISSCGLEPGSGGHSDEGPSKKGNLSKTEKPPGKHKRRAKESTKKL